MPRLAHLPPHLPLVRRPLTDPAGPTRELLTCTRAGGREHPAVAAVLAELNTQAEAMAAAVAA